MKDEALVAGADELLNKSRLRGLWGPQTPYGAWLLETEITTIFFGGVNGCVAGYDVIYVDDVSATTSPEVYGMVRYNSNWDGESLRGKQSPSLLRGAGILDIGERWRRTILNQVSLETSSSIIAAMTAYV